MLNCERAAQCNCGIPTAVAHVIEKYDQCGLIEQRLDFVTPSRYYLTCGPGPSGVLITFS